MTTDPRVALGALVAALETHLELTVERRGEDDPRVVAAYQRIADAFVAYDDALLDAYGEVTPLDIYREDDEEEELDDDLDHDLDADDDLDDDLDEDFADEDDDELDLVDLDDEDDQDEPELEEDKGRRP
jgi:hypothetical protein